MGHCLTKASVLRCPHGGTVQVSMANQLAKAAKSVMLRVVDTFIVSNCPCQIAGTLHPCVRVEWSRPSTRIRIAGAPVLTTDSLGRCFAADGAMQGFVLSDSSQQLKMI